MVNKDLNKSRVDRQNLLNNDVALNELRLHLGLTGLVFEDDVWFTNAQVADFFNVSRMTINRYVNNYSDELLHNGYEVLKGQRLKNFKDLFGDLIYSDLEIDLAQSNIDVTHEEKFDNKQRLARLKSLGVFNFRAFLNMAMLLSESEQAKHLRSVMLDIVLDTLHKKAGGSTKYINQREEDFLHAVLKEPEYRKEFTQALNSYLAMGNYKYAVYTDKIYQSIFKEKSKEYKTLLNLSAKDRIRDTFYADILSLVSSFENGLAYEMRKASEKKGEKLTPKELNALFEEYANHPGNKPQLEMARTRMASRDYGLRQVIHDNLEEYITNLSSDEFQRFLGESSKTIQERIEENIDVFKRLKDR